MTDKIHELIEQRNRALSTALSMENQFLKEHIKVNNAIGIIASLLVQLEGVDYPTAKLMATDMLGCAP